MKLIFKVLFVWERTAQGHLETFKNMETRLIESNFSMRGPPLLSHFCIFMIMIMIMIMIRMMMMIIIIIEGSS